MSSAVVSTSAARGRPFFFDDQTEGEVHSDAKEFRSLDRTAERNLSHRNNSLLPNQLGKIPVAGVTPASQLEIRPAPEMASSGIADLDALIGGLPRGCLTEICGPASSGRTTVLLAALAAATSRGEFCALVDASDALDPYSAASAGLDLDRLLWVRCGEDHGDASQRHKRPQQTPGGTNQKNRKTDASEHRIEQALRATDLLLESGGFGLIVLELADLPPQAARRIPLTTWFRFRRAIEHKSTILLVIEQQPIAGSCSSLLLQLRSQSKWNEERPLAHTRLLTGLDISVEFTHSRLERKPSRSISFATKTAWAG